MSKRMKLLQKILEDSKLTSKAQEQVSSPSEIDKTTADKLANDIFEEIYDEVYQQIINEVKV